MSKQKNKQTIKANTAGAAQKIIDKKNSEREDIKGQPENKPLTADMKKLRLRSLIPVAVAILLYLFIWKKSNVRVLDPWYKAGIYLDSAVAAKDNLKRAYYLKEAGEKIPPVLEKFPFHARVHFITGYYYQLTGKNDSALQEYRIAAKLDSGGTINTVWPQAEQQMAFIYFQKADTLTRQGKIDSAKSVIHHGMIDAPHNDALNKQLGTIFFNAMQSDSAMYYYTKAISLNPQDADSYNNIGVIYQNKGEFNKALEYYNAALRVNPQHPNAARNIKMLQQYLQNNNNNQNKK